MDHRIGRAFSRVPQEYATEGLRTLCIACRDVSDAEYRQWSAIYDQAAQTINGRGEALDKAAELIEKDMFLLGATAIEDKLQDGVPDAIHTLQMAGIKVWVLTGDRQETAINIGMSCRLISESMNLVRDTLCSFREPWFIPPTGYCERRDCTWDEGLPRKTVDRDQESKEHRRTGRSCPDYWSVAGVAPEFLQGVDIPA